MEKGKRIKAKLQLPEAIIQHIQSFLNEKEATQTNLLSTSWYNAWLTRPNLSFDQKSDAWLTSPNLSFDQKSNDDTQSSENRFWKLVNNTVERYEKLNLKIECLRLWIHGEHSLVNELIIRALKRGATCLDFKIYNENGEFALPHQVFGFEKLTRLYVSGCKIGTGADGRVSCWRLESLTLEKVYAQGNIIWEIISSCPLIKNFSFSTTPHRWALTEFGKQNVVDGPILVNEFHKLKRLFLCRVRVHPLYFDGFSSKFPCLKDLALHNCHGCTDIQISSPSLECIDFTCYHILRRAEFDVPRIHKFTFSGLNVPLLLFKADVSNWESYIYIERHCPPNATWFLELNKLLKKLSLSKVSLYLEIWSEKPSKYVGNFQGLRNKPKVENLMINGPYSACPTLFYSLFNCCRPIYISHYWCPKFYPKSCGGEYDLMASMNSCTAYQRMRAAGECDLEEVSVEFYDESVFAWRPQLSDTSTSPGPADEHEIRLHLRWRR